MKKLFLWAFSLCLLCGCGDAGVSRQEVDALKQENEQLKSQAERLEAQIGIVADAINEIALQEDMIFVDDEGSDIRDRNVLKSRMEALRVRLLVQQGKIAELENALANSGQESHNFTALVSQLKTQLAEKDARIASMQTQLENNSITIGNLREQVTSISKQLAETSTAKESLETAVNNQDQLLNEGYYIVATKKELKALGLTEGTFKKKINIDNVDKDKFTRIDIRDAETILIPGKSPKLMIEKPSGSYEVTQNSDGTSTLRIKDPVRFWETSKFLVIQIKD